ncbi:putative metal-binding motif-containing protein, partial [Flavobacterium sp.]|uniref:putative metal-binding motif-containing protein n=1 Tax=Flavobacterium sp. TaxID=239 RepID=UPI00260866C4
MKKQLQKVSLISFLLMLLFYSSATFSQSAGFNSTFIILSVNGGGNTFYDLQASTANADFNGANLGSFCQGSTGLVFKGAEHNNYKCNGCDISSTRINYRIYQTGSPSGSFVVNNIGFTSDFNNGCGGKDQRWSSSSYNVNLLSGLSAGNYTLEVYSDQSTSCSGTQFASNGGANYKATFTVNAIPTLNTVIATAACENGTSSVTMTGLLPSTSGTFFYTNSMTGPLQYSVSGTSTASGTFSFNTPPLPLAANGAIISIVSGSVSSTSCSTNFSGKNVTVVVNPNVTYYRDLDGDGFGNVNVTQVSCSGAPIGYVTNNSDSNDNLLTYVDADADGFGSNVLAASGPSNNSDCNDNQLQYLDNDNDGFGSTTLVACGVTNNSDSNDNLLTYVDADADGFGSNVLAASGPINNSDCNDNQLQYLDNDNDGFGSTTLVACGVSNDTDCNDSNASINPGAVDVCYDGIDNDCNGIIDNVGLPGGCTPIVSTLPAAQCGTIVSGLSTSMY